ncbi:MAG: hypothetical protein D6794_05925 [Deltaproteobacteria bacterium]|nr:MAG: hypothetical protein D6794_05925 [Deltaproteobacteria bacterium]
MFSIPNKAALRRVLLSLLLLAGWGLGAWLLAVRPGGLTARADGPTPQPPAAYDGPVERALFAGG